METTFEDMKTATRWLVLGWMRPEKTGEEGGWRAWTKLNKLPYWAVYDVVAEHGLEIDTLIMVHALPPTIEQLVNSDAPDVPAPHWYSLYRADNSPIKMYPQEISESKFIENLQKQVVPKTEIQAV